MNYNKKVMNNFMHPKNMGEIKNPDGIGEIGNPSCGDIMKVFIKVSKNKKREEIIKEIKFKTFGCAAAIASSSILTQMAKGKTLEQSQNIKMNDIVSELGELPKLKTHCSGMASEALKRAIKNYQDKKINNKNAK